MNSEPPSDISISSETSRPWLIPLSFSELETALSAMLNTLSPACAPGLLELTLVDDKAIADLNEKYLRCKGPTNILSFPAGSGPALGWLALSVETVRREAEIYKQSLPHYTLVMLAHGLAHLMGHEHGEKMDKLSGLAMAAACKCLVAQGGVPCLRCS